MQRLSSGNHTFTIQLWHTNAKNYKQYKFKQNISFTGIKDKNMYIPTVCEKNT